MSYHVTRQNGYYDDEPRIEIATALDEISPGMLVAKYEQEGEYDTATEAVEAAIKLRDLEWHGTAITISAAASIGMYPTHEDGENDYNLRSWADRRDKLAEKKEEEE